MMHNCTHTVALMLENAVISRGFIARLVAADIDINQMIVFDSTFCNSRHVASGHILRTFGNDI